MERTNDRHRPPRRGRMRVRALALGALASASLGALACGSEAPSARLVPARSSTAAAALRPLAAGEPACGPAANAVQARAAGEVARAIYTSELSSQEVSADRAQVEGYAPLLNALAAGERGAVLEAVTSLVYSHTHIVRLRVTRGQGVWADVGGPYIIAPVSGRLILHGRVLGTYTLSVQDDLGYVKLESRYVGLPVLLRSGSQRVPLEGELPASAAHLPTSGRVRYGGSEYVAVSFAARAFPAAPLTVTILVPANAPAGAGCAAVRVAELGRIGERVWGRFVTAGAPPSAYAIAIGGLTGALAFVRAGSHQLASSAGAGPRHIPDSGTVRFHSRTYAVSSFPATSGGVHVRVFQLLNP